MGLLSYQSISIYGCTKKLFGKGPTLSKKYLADDWVNHLPITVYCGLTSTNQIKSKSSNSTTPSAVSSTLTEVV